MHEWRPALPGFAIWSDMHVRTATTGHERYSLLRRLQMHNADLMETHTHIGVHDGYTNRHMGTFGS